MASVPPPAPQGTMIVIGRSGYAAAPGAAERRKRDRGETANSESLRMIIASLPPAATAGPERDRSCDPACLVPGRSDCDGPAGAAKEGAVAGGRARQRPAASDSPPQNQQFGNIEN